MGPNLNACFLQYLGAWSSTTQYRNNQIFTLPGTYFTLNLVTYSGSMYFMNNSATPIKGIAPNADSAWTIWPGAGGGSGTVTSLQDNTANGISISWATPTTTPVPTLSTSINGLVKANGTGFAQAIAGTDYVTPAGTAALATALAGGTANAVAYQSGPGVTAFLTFVANAVLTSNGLALEWSTTVPTENLQTTPTFTPADASGASLAIVVVKSNSKRVGDLIFVSTTITYPSTADASPASISGLPAAVPNSAKVNFTISSGALVVSAGTSLIAQASGSDIAFLTQNTETPITNVQLSGVTLTITGVYSAS